MFFMIRFAAEVKNERLLKKTKVQKKERKKERNCDENEVSGYPWKGSVAWAYLMSDVT